MDLSVKAFVQYLASVHPYNTVKGYKNAANNLVQYIQAKRVDRRTPSLLFGFQEYLLKRGISAKTLQVIMPGAKKYLEWRRAYGDDLPVHPVPDKPVVRRHSPTVLRASAMRQYMVLTSGTDEPFRTAALLYPFSGLRADEMLKIELRQVIRDPGDPNGRRLAFKDVEGKSKRIRTVPIIDPGSNVLYAYLTGWRRAVQDSPWLFPSDGDWKKPYNDRTMRRKMDDIEQAVGGPTLSATVLRHTWATALADAGVPLHHLAQLAGHESIQTTYRNYIGQPTPEKLETEIGKVDLLKKAEGKK